MTDDDGMPCCNQCKQALSLPFQLLDFRGEYHAFSTHTADAIDIAHLCRLGNPSCDPSLHRYLDSARGYAHFRRASDRLFGSTCWQPDRRNLAKARLGAHRSRALLWPDLEGKMTSARRIFC